MLKLQIKFEAFVLICVYYLFHLSLFLLKYCLIYFCPKRAGHLSGVLTPIRANKWPAGAGHLTTFAVSSRQMPCYVPAGGVRGLTLTGALLSSGSNITELIFVTSYTSY